MEETSPLISVISPVYNVAPYLRRCVDSLLAQTFRNFELILVDDGSTDSSGSICDEYSSGKDAEVNVRVNVKVNVNVIHQQNSGVSTARNRGIEAARGKYISFVDADDWVEPGFLQAFAEEVERHPEVDCVIQGFWNHEGTAQAEPYAHYSDAVSFCSELYRLEEKKLIGYVWNKLFRRALIAEKRICFDLHIPIGEDMLFCMSFIDLCQSTSILANTGYHYVFSGHKDYSFLQLNRRLDTFYHHIRQLHSLPTETVDAFLFNEYHFALYILHSLYAERQPRRVRLDYLQKIRQRRNELPARSCRRLESPYNWLSAMVLHLPHLLCDLLLKFIFPERKA